MSCARESKYVNIVFVFEILGVLLEHEAELSVQVLWQLLLQELADLLAVLAVTVCNCEEVAILEAAEVRHRDPHVLVHFIWVAR